VQVAEVESLGNGAVRVGHFFVVRVGLEGVGPGGIVEHGHVVPIGPGDRHLAGRDPDQVGQPEVDVDVGPFDLDEEDLPGSGLVVDALQSVAV
jgi:hypothetical protein